MINITFFAHATSIDNENQKASGWSDCNLSNLGIQQAIELGHRLSDKRYDYIFTSDLKRALDTAKLAFPTNYPIISDERLREINYGVLTGSDISLLRSKSSDYIMKPFPSGESYKDVESRISNFLEFLINKYKESSVMIIAHQAPQLALEVLLNNKTWTQVLEDDWRLHGEWQPGWNYIIIE